MGVYNILWPVGIDAITRQIFYDYSSAVVKRVARENIVFYNNTGGSINEIMIEIEDYKSNLTIVDENQNELVYLTKNEIDKKLKEKNIETQINEKIKVGIDKNERYILYLILNHTVENNSYIRIQLNYIEYRSENRWYSKNENSKSKIISKAKSFWSKLIIRHISNTATYYDKIKFYGDETLSVFNRWQDGINIETRGPYWLVNNKYTDLSNDVTKKFHSKTRENCFSYSMSVDTKKNYNISGHLSISTVKPEPSKLNLIIILLAFTLLFPFSMFIAAYERNMGYLFDSLEVEVVLILTLSFAETKTNLVRFDRFIVAGILVTIILFCGVLCYIL